MRTYKNYIDKDAAGRDWNLATAMVINGKAGMQIMGDWAKGEFLAAGKTPGEDFLCVPVPDTQGAFTFNVDSFVMFDVGGEEARKAQADLAKTIMSPEFQTIFNLNKGSIPVRQDMALDEFDACARSSMEAFVESSKNDALLPSLAHGMAVPPDIEGAITDVITSFFNSDMAAEDAAKRLAQAVQYSKL